MPADRPRPLQFSLLSMFLLTFAVSLLLSATKVFGPGAMVVGALHLTVTALAAEDNLKQIKRHRDPTLVETLRAYATASLLLLRLYAIVALPVVAILGFVAAMMVIGW